MSDRSIDLTDADAEDDRSLAELLSSLTSDVSELVRSQLELAVVELKEEAAQAGRAAGMGLAGAVVAVCALLLLGMAAAWGIAEGLETWLGFLLVGVAYALVAGLLALAARRRAARIRLLPPDTTQTLQEDARWLQQHRS